MKVHLNLATRDLSKSVAFYQTLLVAAPTKHFTDYALFLTEKPGLELALDADPAVKIAEGAHYGIVVDSVDQVDGAIARLQESGYRADIERDETCCYAKQTKVWTTDPDGRRWETYFVVEEAEARDAERATCCPT
jgi:catechol 2,3-dioxygenase-like lactoylglutathione lyase family enzyme